MSFLVLSGDNMRRLLYIILVFVGLTSMVIVMTFIPGVFSGLVTDARGYIYAWTGEELRMWDNSGKEVYSFSSKSSGKISSADVKGGQRILVFYKESQRVISLDNTLSPIGDLLDLRSLGFSDPVACCLSGESGFWIYDGSKDQLSRYGFDGKELASSPILSSLRNGAMPVRMVERGQSILMIMDNGDVHLFDHFGNSIKDLSAKFNKRVLDLSDGVIYSTNTKGDSLFWEDIKTLQEGATVLPGDSISAFSLSEEKLILLEPRGIGIYPKK